MSKTLPPTALVVAGLDPSGGAGLLADVRVAEAHGFRAAGVATVLTEQDSRGLRRADPVDADRVADQIRAVLADVEVATVKIGAIGDESIARAVADGLALTSAPAVWDPVFFASAGAPPLFAGDPEAALAALAPHLSVITPNMGEAERLAGVALAGAEEGGEGGEGGEDAIEAAKRAADILAARAGAALVKGGHGGTRRARDVLVGGDRVAILDGPRAAGGEDVHGTGCALSTALACRLGDGAELERAAREAKDFVAGRLGAPVRAGRGRPAVV